MMTRTYMRLFGGLAVLAALSLNVGCDGETYNDITDADPINQQEPGEGADPTIVPVQEEPSGTPLEPNLEKGQREGYRGTEVEDAAEPGRDQYVAQVEARLKEMDQRINKLQETVADTDEPEREALEKRVEEMQQQRDMVQKKLDELKTADDQNWEQIRADVEKALDTLQTTAGAV